MDDHDGMQVNTPIHRSGAGRVRSAALLLSLSLAACAEGGDHPGPQITGYNTYGTLGSGGPIEDTDTDGETDGPMPEPGHVWCSRADNALYQDGADVVDITYSDGSSPQGCHCAAQETHDWLLANMTGSVVPTDGSVTLPVDVLSLRNNIYQEAENECLSLVPGSQPSNCLDGDVNGSAMDTAPSTPGFQPAPLSYRDRFGEESCTLTRYYEVFPPSGECSFLDGEYDFSAKDGSNALEVGMGFVDELLRAPGCLYLERGRIELNPQGSFEFVHVAKGELLHELGIRSGDVPITLNDIGISTVDGAYAAWEALQDETNFALVVQRGRETITLEFVLI